MAETVRIITARLAIEANEADQFHILMVEPNGYQRTEMRGVGEIKVGDLLSGAGRVLAVRR